MIDNNFQKQKNYTHQNNPLKLKEDKEKFSTIRVD